MPGCATALLWATRRPALVRNFVWLEFDCDLPKLPLQVFEAPIHFVQSLLELGGLEGSSTFRTLDPRAFEFPNCFLELGVALGAFELDLRIVIDSCHDGFLSSFVSNAKAHLPP